jgi:hypothetical protein
MKVLTGWVLITIVYFLVLIIGGASPMFVNGIPVEYTLFNTTQLIMGISLIVIPYIAAGIYCRIFFRENIKKTLMVSFVPILMERVLIYLIGFLLVTNGGEGTTEGIHTLRFIQGEAAPYFTMSYVLCGLVSLMITILFTQIHKNSSGKNGDLTARN